VWFEFAKIKGAKIILHVKSPAFLDSQIKIEQHAQQLDSMLYVI